MQRLAIPFLVLATPFWVISPHQAWDGHALLLLAGATVILGARTGNRWFLALTIYAALWLLGSQVNMVAQEPGAGQYLAALTHRASAKLVVYLLAAGVVLSAGRDGWISFKLLSLTVLSVCGLEIVLNLLQALGVDPVLRLLHLVSRRYQVVASWDTGGGGTLQNPNVISAYVALALPFAWRWVSRPAVYLGLAVLAMAFAAALHTATAVISIGAGLAALACFTGNRVIVVGCLALALGGALWFLVLDSGWAELLGRELDNGAGARVITWKETLTAWASGEWLLGRGPGTWEIWWATSRPAAAWWEWNYTHNDWLQALFELGALGLVLALGWFASLLRLAWKRRSDHLAPALASVTVTAGVLCLGSFTIHLAALAVVVLAAAGMIERYREVEARG